ncbi:MAG: hypothetical protein B7Y43_05125 [Sphingomonas sp. 28-62-20]|uniref:hypothetical protein n=1 Tax=Sphingomonas sp. 28-62-20 TaxID=1970433 RepID=UPI000BD677C4|nr:MAG: hypothetical protein B7Y43_05125 [Sphingomonas sp. 28-62-20]
MRAALAVLLALGLAGCSGESKPPSPQPRPSAAPDLESAAIAAGVIADPANTDITGLYARDTDRICVVPDQLNYRIGAFVDYGDQQSCSGSGTVTRVGEALHINFAGAAGCDFDARFEGDRIVFPGRLPQACEKLCARRASFAALDVRRLSESVSEASTLRNPKGKLLCTPGG